MRANAFGPGLACFLSAAIIATGRSSAETGVESKWFYGLDVMSPGVTLRRVDERLDFLLDVGFDISGYYFSRDETSSGRARYGGSAGLETMNLLLRYKAIKFGESLSLHASIGSVLQNFYYAGAGLGFMHELGDKNFAYLDADVAFFGAGKTISHYRWAYATDDRIFGGFARRF